MSERHFYSPGESRKSKQPPISRQKFETSGDYHYQYVGQDVASKMRQQERLILRAKRWETIYKHRILRGDFGRLDRAELTDEQRAIAWYANLKRTVPENRDEVRYKVALAKLARSTLEDMLRKKRQQQAESGN